MTQLINADALKDDILKSAVMIDDRGIQTGYEIAIELIKRQPTIDAVPVRHGKWVDIDEQTYTWKVRCSCCGHERSMMSTQGKYPNYCEACGARMDEDE